MSFKITRRCNIVAHAPFHSPKNESQPIEHNVGSQSPAWTGTTQDPYYSNEGPHNFDAAVFKVWSNI